MTLYRTLCAHCKSKLVTERPSQIVHLECAESWAIAQAEKREREEAKKARADAKAERDNTRQRKEAIKRVSKWESECRAIVQKIARIRDKADGCISCHMGPNYGGQWHGSHYRSVGACSALQFNLWNIHKACAQCNLHKGGNRENYRPRLIEKIGADRVEWMDAQNNVSKRSGKEYVEYLKRFKRVMGKRLRRMEKRV